MLSACLAMTEGVWVIKDEIAAHYWRSVRNDGFKDKEKNTNKKIKGIQRKKQRQIQKMWEETDVIATVCF